MGTHVWGSKPQSPRFSELLFKPTCRGCCHTDKTDRYRRQAKGHLKQTGNPPVRPEWGTNALPHSGGAGGKLSPPATQETPTWMQQLTAAAATLFG